MHTKNLIFATIAAFAAFGAAAPLPHTNGMTEAVTAIQTRDLASAVDWVKNLFSGGGSDSGDTEDSENTEETGDTESGSDDETT